MSALLFGAASALTPRAKSADFSPDMLTGDAQSLWSTIQEAVPDAKLSDYFIKPKPHTRRPDSHWANIVRGSAKKQSWTVSGKTAGDKSVESQDISEYDLRTKAVDPSELGVDPGVKQYSGYLDNNDSDKHLFFCMYITAAQR